jgi:hypothetical protein
VRTIEEEGALVFKRGAPIDELARRWLALREVAKQLEKAVREHVEETGEPIPLGDKKGTVWGPRPGTGWETIQSYERTIQLLEDYGMTREQRVEWFRFVGEHHFAGRVRKALDELRVPDGSQERENLVVPVTAFTFTSFRPDPKEGPAPGTTLDQLDRKIDDLML